MAIFNSKGLALLAATTLAASALACQAFASTFVFDIQSDGQGTTGDVTWSVTSGGPNIIVDRAGTWVFDNVSNTFGYANLRTDNYVGGLPSSIGMGIPALNQYVLFQDAGSTPLFTYRGGLTQYNRPTTVDFTVGTYSVDYTISGTSYQVPFVISCSDCGEAQTPTVEVGHTSAVPEPATWAMLILGMGALGAALRRRQSGALVAA